MLSASPVSQMSRLARSRGRLWLSVLFPVLLSLPVPGIAWAGIYKWTDENGTTHFSNIRPDKSAKARNVEVVAQEPKPSSIPDHAATRTEQALLARIESLERQLDARQYAAQAPQGPPPAAYSYPPTPPPAAYSGYYPPVSPPSSYYPGGYDWASSGYYPAYYYPFASSYVVYPRRAFAGRPAFVAPHGGSFHGHGSRGGGGGRGGRR